MQPTWTVLRAMAPLTRVCANAMAPFTPGLCGVLRRDWPPTRALGGSVRPEGGARAPKGRLPGLPGRDRCAPCPCGTRGLPPTTTALIASGCDGGVIQRRGLRHARGGLPAGAQLQGARRDPGLRRARLRVLSSCEHGRKQLGEYLLAIGRCVIRRIRRCLVAMLKL